MLENLFNLIKEQGAEPVINNPVIPNEQNNEVLAEATHSVASGLQSEIAGGGLQNIISMFTGGGQQGSGGASGLLSNPIVQNIISSFVGKLMNNHNVPSSEANNIAGNLIPNVLSNLISKTKDPNDNSFDIAGILGSLTGNNQANNGGGGLDIASLIGKFAGGGLDSNNDGKVGLDDIISKFTGGAQQQQQQAQSQSDPLMDMIKGFMK